MHRLVREWRTLRAELESCGDGSLLCEHEDDDEYDMPSRRDAAGS